MKKINNLFRCGFTVILAILFTNFLFAQIPNWNMENWTSSTKDVVSQWTTFGTITKVTPAQNGSNAIKLQGDSNSGPGAILYGTPTNNNNFSGGTPFTSRPDSLIAYFKYDIVAGDSAWVVVQMSNNGTVFCSNLYEYTGSYTSGFKRMAFKINYFSGQTPDTMFLAFTSTIPNTNGSGGNINTVSWVIIDNISFVGTTQNVPNPDFESWTTQTTFTPNGWEIKNSPWGTNIERTTDAYGGTYAMKLQTVNSGGGMIGGYTETLGPNSNNHSGNWRPSFPINSTPNSLKGFFKFIPQNGDTFTIDIGLFKNGQQVGYGGYASPNALTTYTPISIPINYNNTPPINPDSAIIQMATFAMTGNNNGPRGASVAYIDNLSFDNFIYAGIPSASTQIINELTVYPNPAESKLNIRVMNLGNEKTTLRLFDLNGKEILTQSILPSKNDVDEITLDLNSISNGMYILQIENRTSVTHSKIRIIKQ